MSITVYDNKSGKGGICIKRGKVVAEYIFSTYEEMINKGITLIRMGVTGAFSNYRLPYYLEGETATEIIDHLMGHISEEFRQDITLHFDIETALRNPCQVESSEELSESSDVET